MKGITTWISSERQSSRSKSRNRISVVDPPVSKEAVVLPWDKVEVAGVGSFGKTVVTPTGRGRSRSFWDPQRGPPWGWGRAGDYRKWPCICRNYRNNGNKTKVYHRSSRRMDDHLLDNSPFRTSSGKTRKNLVLWTKRGSETVLTSSSEELGRNSWLQDYPCVCEFIIRCTYELFFAELRSSIDYKFHRFY